MFPCPQLLKKKSLTFSWFGSGSTVHLARVSVCKSPQGGSAPPHACPASPPAAPGPAGDSAAACSLGAPGSGLGMRKALSSAGPGPPVRSAWGRARAVGLTRPGWAPPHSPRGFGLLSVSVAFFSGPTAPWFPVKAVPSSCASSLPGKGAEHLIVRLQGPGVALHHPC